jgi:hypothetical protein
MELPGYDAWKTHNPDDDRCEFCGISSQDYDYGWQPENCTGECRRAWRDPDYERDQIMEDA